MTRIKVYELLSVLVSLDNVAIYSEITQQTSLLQCVLNDIERFDNNSNMLKVLFEIITKMTI